MCWGLAQVTAQLPDELIRDQLMQGAAGYKKRRLCLFACSAAITVGVDLEEQWRFRLRLILDPGHCLERLREQHVQVLLLYRTMGSFRSEKLS